jgi:4-amino-4-deoxy-L-arabinose transferase-like glycosyltransferase
VLIVLSLAWICRTRTARRDDTRLLGEWALVVLTMLFVSERSWKHHYVTLVLPYAYLVYRMGFSTLRKEQRRVLAGALALSALLMASTSSEIGGLFLDGQGHKLAQGYGMFLWAGVVLYVATAWLVLRETRQPAEPAEPAPSLEGRLSAPHFSQTRWA